MVQFTAADVGKLREMTGAGMMDCKKALTEAQGDLNAAVNILRKKGIAASSALGTREAKEGLIAQYIAPGGNLGVLVEIHCQTDFNQNAEVAAGRDVLSDQTFLRLASSQGGTGRDTLLAQNVYGSVQVALSLRK